MRKFFNPQRYKIEDKALCGFIDRDEILSILYAEQNPSMEQVEAVVEKALSKERLTLEETALLVNATTPEAVARIKAGAKQLKQTIYGNRIVLFAPLYIGNRCVNNCSYCGFSASNTKSIRRTLRANEIEQEVVALQNNGHKRLILVYGEHPLYDAKMIADNVRQVYSIRSGNGEIRRVNINAAPFSVEDFKIIKEAGIGTFQVFQESYDPLLYEKNHSEGPKRDFEYRLTALDRAMEAGIDDVGIGALFGMGDWRFEVLGLVRHANHLEQVYGVGPHTISFPRIKIASGVDAGGYEGVSDDDFMRIIAILRLAVPYTGMILTAREQSSFRDEAIAYGVSQIDGGTNIEIGGYSGRNKGQNPDKEQFVIGDDRSLCEIMQELVTQNYIPSFCTACYRKGRTGEHFMAFSVPGFIKRFCTPNALFSFAEYLEDYADESTKERGAVLIEQEIAQLDHCFADEVRRRLALIRSGERDLFL